MTFTASHLFFKIHHFPHPSIPLTCRQGCLLQTIQSFRNGMSPQTKDWLISRNVCPLNVCWIIDSHVFPSSWCVNDGFSLVDTFLLILLVSFIRHYSSWRARHFRSLFFWHFRSLSWMFIVGWSHFGELSAWNFLLKVPSRSIWLKGAKRGRRRVFTREKNGFPSTTMIIIPRQHDMLMITVKFSHDNKDCPFHHLPNPRHDDFLHVFREIHFHTMISCLVNIMIVTDY